MPQSLGAQRGQRTSSGAGSGQRGVTSPGAAGGWHWGGEVTSCSGGSAAGQCGARGRSRRRGQ